MATNNAVNESTAAAGKVLQGQGVGVTSAFSTATYPSTATSTGTILRADGTNWTATTATYPATTTINQVLYSSAANTLTGLATANSAIFATNSSGVPSITTASGNWNNTSRSCFTAYNNTATSNNTGDSTLYTLIFGTEVFDQGNDFDGISTFTAPVTGKYFFSLSVLGQNFNTSHQPLIQITTTARSYRYGNNASAFIGNNTFNFSVIADMTSGDTAKAQFQVSGSTKTVGVYGAAGDPRTIFSGYLVC